MNGRNVSYGASPSNVDPAPISRRRLRMLSEGPRGQATRASVYLRYCGYLMAIVAGCTVTGALLGAAGTTEYGGSLLWFSCALMAVVAAGATMAFPNQRAEIIRQMRHYIFGLCLFPAVGIAFVIWALRGVITTPTAAHDTLANLMNFAVPAIFVITVIVPPIVFIKAITGFHTLHRSTRDDGETLAAHTRQDWLQR